MVKFLKNIVVPVSVYFLTGAGTLFAQQTFSNVPQDTISDNIAVGSGKVLDFKQELLTPDTLRLAWQQVSVSVPFGWDAFLCDYGTCYPSLPISGTMFPIPAGDYGVMSLHIQTHTTAGIAIVRYAVWDALLPSQKDTLTWIINAGTTGVMAEPLQSFAITVFHKQLTVFNSVMACNAIVFFDLSGKVVFQRKMTQPKEIVDLLGLPEGEYICVSSGPAFRRATKVYIEN